MLGGRECINDYRYSGASSMHVVCGQHRVEGDALLNSAAF